MLISTVFYWLGLSFIVWVLGNIFYAMGIQANKSKTANVAFTIPFLISIGLFIALLAYSPLLGWSVSLRYKATVPIVENLVNLSMPECDESFFEKRINYIDRGYETTMIHNYNLGKPGPNKSIQSLEVYSQKESDEIETIIWSFQRKKDFEKVLGELKKYKSSKDKSVTLYNLPRSIFTIKRNGFASENHSYFITVNRKNRS